MKRNAQIWLAACLGSAALLAGCQSTGEMAVEETTTTTTAAQPLPIASPIALTRSSPFVSEMYNFLVQDEVLPPAACSTVFTGSSSIRFWFTLEEDFPALDPVNRGFGGSGIAHATAYFDLLISPHQPREIIFYSGENDVSAGASADDVLASFQAFLEKKTAALGDTPVYFVSIKPSIARLSQLETQTAANRLIADYAATRDDLIFIDITEPMMDGDTPKDLFISDRLHMNAAGYDIWTKVISEALADPERPTAAGCD
ncbi:GDSL-type esterase/lipase family protein [Henriciella marina]|uniref:GDSL-type esterase/lipase family protein n=1 Tax=Henriciella marina TaxID=453851 RepID=A0ABT4LVS0_9PROT|nr:GDSL-type esterase/lipase family protein [Henriciella marina]MCZ4298474.1 GDSL-type esterase/lipase family protein [Henriciella marina]